MGKNSKKRREEKLHKRAQSTRRFDLYNPSERAIVMRDLKVLIGTLTTPAAITERVMEFCQSLSEQEPVYIDCQPESWSRQSCCDTNVAEYVKINGGRIIFGFRLWANSSVYIEAERHAVWSNEESLRDVSFVDTGETRTLFLPDRSDSFEAAPQKVRYAFTPRDKQLIAALNGLESMAPIGQMTREQAWTVMPTYEEWQAGKRMPNLIPMQGGRVL